ncbi:MULTISPECIES: hypothetical protein [Antarcticibacterium]|nr:MULTISPECIES: hypothetical protein [Antarcticibacterium]
MKKERDHQLPNASAYMTGRESRRPRVIFYSANSLQHKALIS